MQRRGSISTSKGQIPVKGAKKSSRILMVNLFLLCFIRLYNKSLKNKIIFNLAKKIFVFIHGGYWQWGSIQASGYMAENFVDNGYLFAAVGYSLAPQSMFQNSHFQRNL
jgi:acetyl esterase/lipase